MFGLTLPRLVSISLVIAYMKKWTALFVVVYFIVATLPHVKRGSAKDDPGQAFLGVLTNIFSPCIVIEEGSKFLVKSSVYATVYHCLSLLLLVIGSQTMTIKPSENPPVLHCFPPVDNVTTNSTFERCLIIDEKIINCTDTEGMFYSDGNNKYATFCNDIKLWLPLVIVCATLMAALLLTLPLTLWLNRLLDPINLTIASKNCLGCCFPHPSGYLPPVWNGEEEFAQCVLSLLHQEPPVGFRTMKIMDERWPKEEGEHWCATVHSSISSKLNRVKACFNQCLKRQAESGGEVQDTDAPVVDEERPLNRDKGGGDEAGNDKGDEEQGGAAIEAEKEKEPGKDTKEAQDQVDQAGVPDSENATRTGRDVLNWLVDKDCHALLRILFVKRGVAVDEATVRRACRTWQGKTVGSPTTIRLLLERLVQDWEKKESPGVSKGLQGSPEEDKDSPEESEESPESGQEAVAEKEAFRLEEAEVNALKVQLKERFRSERQHDLLIRILAKRKGTGKKHHIQIISTINTCVYINMLLQYFVPAAQLTVQIHFPHSHQC